jgi:hypothetical protein
MKTLIISLLFLVSTGLYAQKLEGSVMLFANGKGKVGIGGVTPQFLKLTVKKVTIGTSLAPIVWFDVNKNTHSFGTAGFVIRCDYKRVSFGYNLLTIAGVDTKFFGIGVKL